MTDFVNSTKEGISRTSSGLPHSIQEQPGRRGIVEVCGDKLFYKYDTVALLLFFPVCMVKRTFHFTEVKTGSVRGATFLKKKKQPETNYLICRAESLIPLTKSVQCALPLTWGRRLTSLDYDRRWKDPNLQDSPPPRETVSPARSRGSFRLSVITGTLAENMCHGYNRVW